VLVIPRRSEQAARERAAAETCLSKRPRRCLPVSG
jgi:hypothetical protein